VCGQEFLQALAIQCAAGRGIHVHGTSGSPV
jgi:hypothetical protein